MARQTRHLAELLGPKPGVLTPAACRRCGRRHPYPTGMCGVCVARLNAVSARLDRSGPDKPAVRDTRGDG